MSRNWSKQTHNINNGKKASCCADFEIRMNFFSSVGALFCTGIVLKFFCFVFFYWKHHFLSQVRSLWNVSVLFEREDEIWSRCFYSSDKIRGTIFRNMSEGTNVRICSFSFSLATSYAIIDIFSTCLTLLASLKEKH